MFDLRQFCFCSTFFLLAAAWLFASSADAVAINSTCSRNTDCSARHSQCTIPSPTCGGICACVPGFTYDTVSQDCKRAVYLGGGCNQESDACVGDNIECSGSSCSCNFGYKQGLQGTDCVPNLMTQVAGDVCHDSAQCYYSLVCVSNKCGCYTGYKPFGKYSCSARQVYDSCSSDDDCQLAANSGCVNGRCDCLSGYRAVQYQQDIATKAYACIPNGEGLVGEGSVCNTNFEKGTEIFCEPPFVCSACGDQQVCIRNKPILLSHASTNNHFHSIIFLLITVLSSTTLNFN